MVYLIYYPLYWFIRLLGWLLLSVKVEGREHLPARGPLLIVGNHFGLLDAPVLQFYLPYKITYLAAADLQEFWFFRVAIRGAGAIPVWRGRVDREALRQAQQAVQNGGVLALFPEGGIDPDYIDMAGRGESIQNTPARSYRTEARLTHARPGAAYLATLTQAPILPVAILGGEQFMVNLRRLRRTKILLRIGPVFGPLQIEAGLRGHARRERLDELGNLLMAHVAAQLPPENRGPYAEPQSWLGPTP
jgi:1-acyl-sn-glycerol-3-phosphate acyltransferase